MLSSETHRSFLFSCSPIVGVESCGHCPYIGKLDAILLVLCSYFRQEKRKEEEIQERERKTIFSQKP